MGFIAYQQLTDSAVRIFMECREEGPGAISYTHAVDVQFPAGSEACTLSGVSGILALKKFYKLVFSLEERARERDRDWHEVFASAPALLEYLGYTRNAQRLAGDAKARRRSEP